MKRDDGLVVAGIVLLVFVIGIALGGVARNHSWIEDCDQLGMHRTKTAVYTCARR